MLYALGIRFVGETTARNLAAHFRSLDAVMAASQEELAQAEEVGDKIAGSIREYFADPVNLRIVERLRAAGVQFAADEEQRLSDSLAGLHIVISGTFRRHSRDELKALIESHGGRNLAAVSKNADYLLAGDNMGPAKLAKATKLGVRIISEEDFERMVEEGGRRRPQRDLWQMGNPPMVLFRIRTERANNHCFNFCPILILWVFQFIYFFTFCLYIFDGIRKKYLYLPDEREGLPVGQMSIR